MSLGQGLIEETVVRFNTERYAPVYLDAFPSPESVQLRSILSPGTCLYHQVGRFLRFPRNLSENGFLPAEGWITQKKLNEKGFGLAALGIISGERMPPPVVAFAGLFAKELTGVTGNIVFVEHCCLVFLP